MMRTSRAMVSAVVVTVSTMAFVAAPVDAGGRGEGPVIYVTSQGLYYDSIVTTALPPHGPFQLLEATEDGGLQTEFGPGDQQYVGGRWWVDVDGNNVMDPTDDYFSCPLLGPGRTDP